MGKKSIAVERSYIVVSLTYPIGCASNNRRKRARFLRDIMHASLELETTEKETEYWQLPISHETSWHELCRCFKKNDIPLTSVHRMQCADSQGRIGHGRELRPSGSGEVFAFTKHREKESAAAYTQAEKSGLFEWQRLALQFLDSRFVSREKARFLQDADTELCLYLGQPNNQAALELIIQKKLDEIADEYRKSPSPALEVALELWTTRLSEWYSYLGKTTKMQLRAAENEPIVIKDEAREKRLEALREVEAWRLPRAESKLPERIIVSESSLPSWKASFQTAQNNLLESKEFQTLGNVRHAFEFWQQFSENIEYSEKQYDDLPIYLHTPLKSLGLIHTV
jgi:hypothetical protein